MDEQIEDVNLEGVTPQTDTSSVEETTEDALGQEDLQSQGQEAETVGESNKGAGARIRQLNQRAKQAEEKAQSLEQRIAELTGGVTPGAQVPQYQPQVEQEPILAPGEEIDAVEFERRMKVREQKNLQQVNAMIELRQKQSEAISRIRTESQKVVSRYPQLDPESEHFNKDLSDAITEATEGYITKNPYSASVETYVDKLMKPYKGAVDKEVGKVSENLAKQVSQTALRPTQIRSSEKSADEKSIAELEAELGIVH